MFRSLRFRLPALFLVGIVLAGVISTLIAVKLFQDYARGRKYNELKREATGLALLYSDQAGHRNADRTSLKDAKHIIQPFHTYCILSAGTTFKFRASE